MADVLTPQQRRLIMSRIRSHLGVSSGVVKSSVISELRTREARKLGNPAAIYLSLD